MGGCAGGCIILCYFYFIFFRVGWLLCCWDWGECRVRNVGPALNMLLGLGIACSLVMASRHESVYQIQDQFGLVVSFGFLLVSLLGSIIFVPLAGFNVGKR